MRSFASALEGDPAQLGQRWAWQVEWKWDGIRGQFIRRAGKCHLWSRGEERITERFPEIGDAAGSPGLSNPGIELLDRWIRAHTLEKFGPMRSVEPTQVFELAYEGIAASGRHKSGIALPDSPTFPASSG